VIHKRDQSSLVYKHAVRRLTDRLIDLMLFRQGVFVEEFENRFEYFNG